MTATQIRGLAQIAFWRNVDSLALDGLDHEGRARLRPQRVFQGLQIAQRHGMTVGQQIAKAGAENLVTVDGQRSIGQSVKSLARENYRRSTGRAARKLDGGLDALGARVGEVDLVQRRVGHALLQLRREQPGQVGDRRGHRLGREERQLFHASTLGQRRAHRAAAGPRTQNPPVS